MKSSSNAILIGRHQTGEPDDFLDAFNAVLARFGMEMLPLENEAAAGDLYFNADVVCVKHGDDTGDILYVRMPDGSRTVATRPECEHLIKRSELRIVGRQKPVLNSPRPVVILGTVVTAAQIYDKVLFKMQE